MQIEGLAVEIGLYPDGFELIDVPAFTGPTPAECSLGGPAFRPRTDRRETLAFRLSNLESPAAVSFVNATDDARRVRFFDQYGFIARPDPAIPRSLFIRREDVVLLQDQLRALLQRVQVLQTRPDMRGPVLTTLNRYFLKEDVFSPRLTFHLGGPRGAPRLLLTCRDLYAFMMTEVAMIITNEVAIYECAQCHTFFTTGPLTHRRSHAKFCSDRCRVAAMRDRQKLETEEQKYERAKKVVEKYRRRNAGKLGR